MSNSKDIILYHYDFSPYSKRVIWYLNLRKIPYSQCLVSTMMPRPEITLLGTQYRRIPILTIGKDIYLDTRLILQKLETLFPPSPSHPSLTPTEPEHLALQKLLEAWSVEGGGAFMRAVQLLPSDLPALNDEKWVKDREDFSGGSWAVWALHWIRNIPNALPQDLLSATQYPKVHAWIDRFDAIIKEAAKSSPSPKCLNGEEALKQIEQSGWAEKEAEVDGNDPFGLGKGDEVEVFPTDTGFSRKDRGRLLGLNGTEIVLDGRSEGGMGVRIHAPRNGFKVRRVGKM